MKRITSILAIVATVASIATAGTLKDKVIYVNPGHGGWTANDRPIATINYEVMVEMFRDTLIDAYIEGWSGAEYLLGGDYKLNVNEIIEALNKSYNGQTIYEIMAEHYKNGTLSEIQNELESEWHRVYNKGSVDYAENFPITIYKSWQTMLDDRVRDPHWELQGIKIPIDEKFQIDGEYASFPGDFDSAYLNANCRCFLNFSVE